MRKYKLFELGDHETMMDMYTRFTHITNELKSLGKSFTSEEFGKEDPEVFTSFLGSQSHGYPRGQGYEKDHLG